MIAEYLIVIMFLGKFDRNAVSNELPPLLPMRTKTV